MKKRLKFELVSKVLGHAYETSNELHYESDSKPSDKTLISLDVSKF